MFQHEDIRILVVDDEPAIRMLLEELLSREGYQCRQAETVEQAIARLGGEPFHLVLSDLRMPGMDGFDLLRHVKGMEEETGVLMVSAVDDISTAVQLLREGAYDYLLKPFRPDDVIERVRAAAERVLLTRQNRRYALHLRDEVERRTEELRSIQDDLRRSEEIRRLILEQAGEAFLTLDAHTGEVLEANRCAETLFLFNRGHMAGLRFDALDAEGRSFDQFLAWTKRDQDETGHSQVLLQRRNGEPFRATVSVSRIDSPDGPLVFVVLREVVADHSAWLKVLGTLSHELRTPLTSILGHAELVEQSAAQLGSQSRRSLRNIRVNARQCLRLAEDLLDLTLREGKETPLRCEPLDAASVLQQAAATLEPLAVEKSLDLQIRTDGELPLFHGDSGAVQRILLNLGGNALHYTTNGGVRLRARWTGDCLEIRVIDTGVGISTQDRERVFAEGERAGQGRVPGAGIGLAIARRLARRMGGHVDLWSRYGLGSVFTLRLPLGTLAGADGEGQEWVETA